MQDEDYELEDAETVESDDGDNTSQEAEEQLYDLE